MDVSILPNLDPASLSPALNTTLVTDKAGLQQITDFFSRVTVFGLDTETNVVKSFIDRKLRVIQIGDKNEQYVIDLLAFAGTQERLEQQGGMVAPDWAIDVVETLRPALDGNSHLKVGYNLQFEYEVLLWCLGLYSWNFYDCMLVEKAIYAGAVHFMVRDFWAMDDTIGRYFGRALDKTLQTSFDLCTPLTEDQIVYAALDTRLPLAIMAAQRPTIAKDRLEQVCEIENSAIPAFGDIHINGFYLDATKWLSVVESNKADHTTNIAELDKHFLPFMGKKGELDIDLAAIEYKWKNEKNTDIRKEYRKEYQEARRELKENADMVAVCEGEARVNYGSNPQLLAALRTVGFGPKKLPNTNDRSLKKLEASPIIKAIMAYRKSAKSLSTYGVTFVEKFINPTTKRVHSRINQYGAATGRTSSTDPNIQNIPKKSVYRSCFVAEDGNVLITADQSGAELRILAELSGEPVWVNAFNNGWDVHSVGAEMLFGPVWAEAAEENCAYYHKDHKKCKCPGHEKLRDQIKSINFGIAYGMEAQKLSESLKITKAAAQELLDLYRKTFKCVTAYLAHSGDLAKKTMQCRTVSGRRRLFPKPSWEKAKELAIERLVEEGKGTADTVTSSDISRAYYNMYGNIEREGKNTPIQGSNADIIKRAMGCGFSEDGQPYMWHKVRAYKAKLVNCVHDEVVLEAREEIASELEKVIVECMVRAGASLIHKVVMEVESCIDKKWSKG